MVHPKSALPLAFLAVHLCSAIPIAPQQAVLELQRSKDNIGNLISDITASNLPTAKIDYENLQAYLDDFGFYLGELNDATCVETPPVGSTGAAATTQSAVVASINSITSSLASLSSSISANNKAAASAAYHAAQADLESTYDFIFGVASTSAPPSPPSTSSPAPQAVYSDIQSALVALNNLAFDIIKSDYATAKSDLQSISAQINSQVAPVAQCNFTSTSASTCTSAISCIQDAQLGLNEVAGDLLASASTSTHCQAVGADLAAALSFISEA